MYQEVDRLFLSEAEKAANDIILKKHTDILHIDVLEIAVHPDKYTRVDVAMTKTISN